MWKESGEDSACCDFALAVAVPQIDDQTRWDYFIKVTNGHDNNCHQLQGRHGAVGEGAGGELLQAVHVPERSADARQC